MKTLSPICLEDDCEASWDDAKTRLKVAAETFGYPHFITLDEVAYAYLDRDSYVAEVAADSDEDETGAARQWFDAEARRVNGYEEALRTLYPWFHEGEDMPERIKLEGRIGGFQ